MFFFFFLHWSVLTSVAHGMQLTPAVHGYAQHGRFVVAAFEGVSFQRVGQECYVRHHDAVGLLYVVQLLHGEKDSSMRSKSLLKL